MNDLYKGDPPVGIGLIAIFLAVYSLRPVSRISGTLVNKVYKAISDLEGSRVVFEFTSGDKKRIAQQKNENASKSRKFWFASSWNIALNIAAAILYTWLFTKGSV